MRHILTSSLAVSLQAKHTKKEKKAEVAIFFLYVFFFLLWAVGYALGIIEHETSFLLGFPLWFFISCIFAFIAVFFGLWGIIKWVFK